MTDRYNTLTVVLDKPMRDDDAESVLQAIRMIKHVQSVKGNVADHSEYMAVERAKSELGQKLFDVIYPQRKD